MNVVFHALLGLLLAELIGIDSISGILVGVLLSVVPDFDHIPHLKKAFRTRRFGVESRSSFHELVGLFLVSLGALAVGIVDPNLSLLGFCCGLSHFAVDFLTRPSRPLYPFSARKVDLNIYPRDLKKMFVLDAILTAALGLVYVVIKTV